MKFTPTTHTVDVDGEIVPVMQSDTGRLFVTDSKSRSWSAMTLETLQMRIARTLTPPRLGETEKVYAERLSAADQSTPVDTVLTKPTMSTHGVVIFDYKGTDSSRPNVHAFGFMQTEEKDRGLDFIDRPIKGWSVAQEVAAIHWLKHTTYTNREGCLYAEQHTFAYEPAVLIENLFRWGIDMDKFDPTLPREA